MDQIAARADFLGDDRAHTPPQDAAWAQFSRTDQAGAFCNAWLTLQCGRIAGTRAGLLLLLDDGGAFSPAATVALDVTDVADLVPAAERALRERRGIVSHADGGTTHVAYPVEVRGTLWGVVVVAVAAAPDALQETLRALRWGAGWIEMLFHRREAERDAARLARAHAALRIATGVAEGGTLAGAAVILANAVASHTRARRVSVAAVTRGRSKLLALSHTASISARLRLSDALMNVMDEALDQAASCVHPPHGDAAALVAHPDFARAHATSIGSVLMWHAGAPCAVLTLEQDAPVTPETLRLLEAVAELAAPLLALRQALDQPLAGRLPRAGRSAWQAVAGRDHPAARAALLAGAALVAAGVFVRMPDRVGGKAAIEGAVQLAAVAPYDAYVLTAPHRAGDIVDAGTVIATLDTRELQLEALKHEAERDQAALKRQDAEGKHDRAQAAIFAANGAEAEAALMLARDHIARAELRAPFRAVIVSGDLSQQLGAPVERGKTLFQMAPLDAYRVAVNVDERDIARVRPGQPGTLILSGLTNAPAAFTVTSIVPVAQTGDGRTTFRVEGSLDAASPSLRPGMEGIGKIAAGRARAAWVYTHPIAEWLRQAAWTWLP